MKRTIRNRIVEHVTARAGDLVPHPLNFRRHPPAQRRALAGSLREIGFARSLVGVRLADGRIQLLDGHLRADLDPDLDVVVELLDVTAEEAHQLMLTLDPLAALATTETAVAAELARLVETDSKALQALWDSVARAERPAPAADPGPPEIPEQWLVLIECDSEARQLELLSRFAGEGLRCRALLS
jgi:hypothetical protein